jgi:hypothetical protein
MLVAAVAHPDERVARIAAEGLQRVATWLLRRAAATGAAGQHDAMRPFLAAMAAAAGPAPERARARTLLAAGLCTLNQVDP